jgi:hypothetical protein
MKRREGPSLSGGVWMGCAFGGSRLARRQGLNRNVCCVSKSSIQRSQHTSKFARIPPGHVFEAGAFPALCCIFASLFS